MLSTSVNARAGSAWTRLKTAAKMQSAVDFRKFAGCFINPSVLDRMGESRNTLALLITLDKRNRAPWLRRVQLPGMNSFGFIR